MTNQYQLLQPAPFTDDQGNYWPNAVNVIAVGTNYKTAQAQAQATGFQLVTNFWDTCAVTVEVSK